MQKTFIERVADHLIEEHEHFENVLVILPSRRSVFFFGETLRSRLNRTSWMPRIIAIEDFVEEITDCRKSSNEELILEAYPVYKEVFGLFGDSFKNYLNFINILLSDLNDIDAYALDVKDLFAYLRDERALKTWTPGNEKLSNFQERYLRFWENLGPFYEKLTAKFDETGGGWHGYIYRKAAQNADRKTKNRYPEITDIHWVGFNTFNTCEEEIFRTFTGAFNCKIHLSTDAFYFEDKEHDAGRFLRVLTEKFPTHHVLYSSRGFEDENKVINCHGVNGEYAMAKMAGALLAEADRNEKTALISADENLLIPILSALPEDLESVNVTMGLPLSKSTAFHFLKTLFKVRVAMERDGAKRLHVPDLIALLSHAGYGKLLSLNAGDTVKKLLDSQKKFMTHDEIFGGDLLPGEQRKILGELLAADQSPGRWFEAVTRFVETRNDEQTQREDRLESIRFEMLASVMKRTLYYVKTYGYISDIEDLEKFFNISAEGITVPIKGERSDFLQIMGMLETRTLDFDRIIVTSANEGTLPAGKKGNSLIPYEVKKYFNLPTHRHKDAVFAYHFYRLLQHPRQIDLLYDTSVSQTGFKEPSRFIRQLEIDPSGKFKGTFTDKTYNFPRQKIGEGLKPVVKTEGVTERIRQYLTNPEGGLSASGLNDLMNSPLNFYISKVLHIKEPKELEENIENSTFGTAVHDTLEQLFKPCTDKRIIAENDIEVMRGRIDEVLAAEFDKHFKGGRRTGSNYLTFSVAQKMIRSFLDMQGREIAEGRKYHIAAMETKTRSKLTVRTAECGISGYPDRVDSENGVLKVIDYKTGKVDPGELKIKSVEQLFEKENTRKFDKPRQILFYAWLVSRQFPGSKLEAGIYSMRTISSGYLPLAIDGEQTLTSAHFDEFEAGLTSVLDDLLNPDIDLVQPRKATYTLFE